MGLLGGKNKYENLTLAEFQSTPPPRWCFWVEGGKLQADTSGFIPYIMRSFSFFGTNLESWFSALLGSTFSTPGRIKESYPFLLHHYVALLSGLRSILLAAWDVWQDDRPGKRQTLSNNPMGKDLIEKSTVIHLYGALAFLQNSVKEHNRLVMTAALGFTDWDASFMEYKVWEKATGPGLVKTLRQDFLEIGATPSTLQLEVDRLSAGGTGPYIPAPAAPSAPPVPSPPPVPSGPTLSEDELAKLQMLYAEMPSERLRQLLAEAAELRPGAEPLLRQELEKRGEDKGE